MNAERLRFALARARADLRRALASLRTRGLAATVRKALERARGRLGARTLQQALWMPAPEAPLPSSVPCAGQPAASIVIPVYGQLAMTLDCLRALAAHPPRVPVEIIVVDDASPDASADVLAGIAGLRLHRRRVNGGFIAACNEGAALAHGQFLVLLNNDTVPQPGWLDALLDTFATQPRTGLVGAQLIYPDGRLQEAGGVVLADGSCWNYGRFGHPHDARYAYLREADYCSGAAIALPRALFAQLGGFDTRYAPAYYEDTDLAFAVRAAGLRVLYQPAARVVHREGASAGTDPASGMKAGQVRNRPVFAAKWHAALSTQLPAGSEPTPALLHRQQRQILVIDAATPRPDRDSGSLRLVELMKLLQAEGAHVVFTPADGAFAGEATQALQALGIECWHAPWLKDFPAFLKAQGGRFDAALVSRHYVAGPLLPLLRRLAPQARIVFDTVDLHFLREQRSADYGAATAQVAATRTSELALVAAADATLVVSHAERALLAQLAPQARVEVLSNLHAVVEDAPGFTARSGLLFVGGFHHPPNTDAVLWFVREVMPLLRAHLPGVPLHVVGADPPAPIRALAAADVRIHGHVPDLAPLLRQARVSIAPLRFGAGVKGKVNQAMAHGLPVVATAIAAEGMHLHDGIDVLLADDAAAFADAVIHLYTDPARWQRLADGGRDNVRLHFSADAARETVRRVFFDIPGHTGPTTA